MAWLQLIAVSVVLFLFQLAVPGFTRVLEFLPATAWAMPWTFVTAIFLHANLAHLFFNMWSLFVFGSILEQRIGERRFYALYFLSGIVGNVAYLLFYPADIPGLGASGAIYGVLGATAVLAPNLLVFFGFVPMPLWIAAIFWFFLEFFSAGAPDAIAHLVHVAGLGVGILWARMLKREASEFSLNERRW